MAFPAKKQIKKWEKKGSMLFGFIVILVGAGFIFLAFKYDVRSNFGGFGATVGGLICFFGLGWSIVLLCLSIAGVFADSSVLDDGSYYKVLSVTQDPNDPMTQYVIYSLNKEKVRDLRLKTKGTNSIPTGMVRWDSKDGIFVSLSAEVSK